MMMWKKDYWFGLTIVALLGVLPAGMTLMASPDAKLQSFLKESHATAEQASAYKFAMKHPEVLSKIPCFCGCGKQGHKSNKSCFITENAQLAKSKPFDHHGLVCPMCVSIALKAQSLYNQGVPLKQIRQKVDAAFAAHSNLHPTPTPKP